MLTLFVKSDGGSGMASLRIVHLLRRYTKRLTVLAPLNCASAATMLALGADTIAMGPLSFLTAVDTSLEHDLSPLDHTNNLVAVSNDEVERVIRLWKETRARQDSVNPTRSSTSTFTPWSSAPSTARAASRSCSAARSSATTCRTSEGRAHQPAAQLVLPAHQYPITSREARRLGLDVRDIDPSSTSCCRS
jgi:membrane-bound ClpP family serine protease